MKVKLVMKLHGCFFRVADNRFALLSAEGMKHSIKRKL
jgi:hypothetical protein